MVRCAECKGGKNCLTTDCIRGRSQEEKQKRERALFPHTQGEECPTAAIGARGPAAADIAVLHSATAVWMI